MSDPATHRLDDSSAPGDGVDSEVERALQEARDAEASSAIAHDTDFDALFSDIEETRKTESQSWSGRLRQLPTSARFLMAMIVLALIVGMSSLMWPRPDMHVYPIVRMSVVLVSLVVLIASAVKLATWPMHRPEPPSTLSWGLLIVGGVVAPVALAALPPAHLAHAASLGGTGADFWPDAARCFSFGTALALPVLILMRMLDRSAHGSWWRAGLAAVAAGLAGDLALQLHCPVTGSWHLVVGHASVVVILLVIYGGIVYAGERRESGSG